MHAFRTLLALVALAAGLQAAHAQTSQDWPNRPVRLIVPFAAGGSTDVAARLIGDYLSRVAGQQFYVENRAGANGVIGMDAAAKSDPDGYTVLVTADAIASNPHVYKVGHDPLKDLVPVIQLSRQPVVLAVHPSLGVGALDELVALVKREPGLRYATGSGQGSPQHMVVQWFAKLSGIEVEQVAYRGGGAAINDLIAGHVKLGSLGSTPLIPHYKAGALRLLAQTTAARSESLPDVPTFGEAGIEGLVLDQWLGVLVSAGTPPEIVARLNADIGKALANPAIRANLLQSAQEPIGGTPEAFAARVREDFEKYGRLVQELNIKVAR
jgi:tripartite-type tricarboxylate transporter receptor subunit TctC